MHEPLLASARQPVANEAAQTLQSQHSVSDLPVLKRLFSAIYYFPWPPLRWAALLLQSCRTVLHVYISGSAHAITGDRSGIQQLQ